MQKTAETQYPIHPLLSARWSPRSFSPRPIPQDDLLSLFEAARWTASSGNGQPWAFVITSGGSQGHARFVEILSGNNQRWAKDAPLLVLGLAKRDRREGQPNAWAQYDLGQAVANLTLEATSRGLFLHQIGGFNRELSRELFGIPPDYDPVVAIAIGYLGSLEDLPEDLRDRELGPRDRRTVTEFVFANRWNEPLSAGQPVTDGSQPNIDQP